MHSDRFNNCVDLLWNNIFQKTTDLPLNEHTDLVCSGLAMGREESEGNYYQFISKSNNYFLLELVNSNYFLEEPACINAGLNYFASVGFNPFFNTHISKFEASIGGYIEQYSLALKLFQLGGVDKKLLFEHQEREDLTKGEKFPQWKGILVKAPLIADLPDYIFIPANHAGPDIIAANEIYSIKRYTGKIS